MVVPTATTCPPKESAEPSQPSQPSRLIVPNPKVLTSTVWRLLTHMELLPGCRHPAGIGTSRSA